MIGSVIDKYEVLAKVGEGGMATVYLAKHVTLGREVAIKVLHPHLSASTRNRLRFAREARAIEHLDHENILEIYDYSGTDVQDCYIVTEFVRGRTLHQLLRERGLLPSEVAAMIGLKLSSALSYAHKAGIIHRDLKPENVMLADDGTVKLMDFGIARFLDETTVTMTGALVGSPAYMSPEQALERAVEARSDLFSLGALVFHLVTGRMPFSGSNPSIVLRNIIEARRPEVLELQPAASARLADVLERLLQTNPEARFENAMQVRDAFADVLDESGVEVDAPRWSLVSYLTDPESYEESLLEHLDHHLLQSGRRSFDEGDHLGAQRMFNRLLARRPEHEEVLEILASQQFPEVIERPQEPDRTPVTMAALLLTGALAGGAWYFFRPAPPPEPVHVEETVLVDDPVDLAVSEVDEPLLVEEPIVVEEPVKSVGSVRSVKTPPTPVVTDVVADAELAPEPVAPDPGTLRVEMNQIGWGDLMVDGEELGQVSNAAPVSLELPAGEHTVIVTQVYAYDFIQTVELSEGAETMVKVVLTKKPLWLQFTNHLAPECDVFLDGEPRGTIDSLPPKVEIEVPRRKQSVEVEVRVECGEETESWTVSGGAGTTVRIPPAP
ncbi:MAG: protein kinase [Proteobacteria bacterium]|nr:protein kinase [Pseudomonadota bacterium]MCP4919109.1 protein kinase [Pseudomonadota bacterium]